MTDIRPGNDCVLGQMPGWDFLRPNPSVTHMEVLNVRAECGVRIVSGIDAGGRLAWLITATDPSTGNIGQAWCYDRRAVQGLIDGFARALKE